MYYLKRRKFIYDFITIGFVKKAHEHINVVNALLDNLKNTKWNFIILIPRHIVSVIDPRVLIGGRTVLF